MKDLDYIMEVSGRAGALDIHLSSNFYPPLPGEVKRIFQDAFQGYWAGLYGVPGLERELSRVYKGRLDQYDFWQFLEEWDLEGGWDE
jgi:hypothetical protein